MEKEEINIKETYKIMNRLINDGKIKFDYYNSSLPLDLVQVCHNKKDGTIEISFRDVLTERVEELRRIMPEKDTN
ncbi:MAG: hypothetical protein E7313_08175 [Clostridiales bacterium]|nr:hypothetical protein [Clostridiales bacterium]